LGQFATKQKAGEKITLPGLAPEKVENQSTRGLMFDLFEFDILRTAKKLVVKSET
jgi:hypothetical protein